MTSPPSSPSWERLLAWIVVVAVCLQVLANVLPKLLPGLAVLAVIFVTVRLALFHTRQW